MGIFDRFKKNKENFIEETGREEKKFETIEPVNNSYEALIKEYEKMNIEQPGKYPLTFVFRDTYQKQLAIIKKIDYYIYNFRGIYINYKSPFIN